MASMSKAPAGSDLRLSVFTVQDHYPDLPRTVAQLYQETIDQAVLAERLGYDAIFVAEHHFHPYGAVPDPTVLLATIAARTTRLRLGPAVAILPFHNPLTVAESYAMVDLLSGGRLILGVGSGYLKHEFAGYDIPLEEKRDRFDESLAALTRALAGESFTARGKHVTVPGVAINLLPMQRPTPPIAVAVLRREAAYHIGKQGHDLMSVPYASVDRFDEVGLILDDYRKGRKEGGHDPAGGSQYFAFHCHVAESDDAARRHAAEAFDLYVATRLYAKSQTYDDILRSGLGLFGSVATVTDKLVKLYAMGIRHVLALMNFGALPDARVRDCMALMAEEVMPRARKKIAGL